MIQRLSIYLIAQLAIFVATVSFFKRVVPEFTASLSTWLTETTGSTENLPIALGYGAICLVPLWLARKNKLTLICIAGATLGWLMGRITGDSMLPAVAFYFALFSLCLFSHRYYMAAISLAITFYGAVLIKLYGFAFPVVAHAVYLALIWNLMHVALISYPIYRKPKKKFAGESSQATAEYKEAA